MKSTLLSEASGLNPPLKDSAVGADHLNILAAVDAEGDAAAACEQQ